MMVKLVSATVFLIALFTTESVSELSSLQMLRSSVDQQYSRHLSYEMIAYYEPKSQVTDHNTIDLDQEAIELQLSASTDQSYEVARDIYTKGGHSKSVAVVTLATPLTKSLKTATSVTGKNSDGMLVVGKIYDNYSSGASEIGVQYKTIDIQKFVVGCQVGGLAKPNLSGCLTASGTLNVDGFDDDLAYSYDPKTENVNKRTIQGFSTRAEEQMYRCENCPYETYRKFREYYGFFDYADKLINAAFDASSTKFTRGNFNFERYGFDGRTEAIKKATAYLSIWMYVIREMEDALDNCQEACTKEGCNAVTVHCWDEAVAYYTGSLEGTDGSGSGKLLYALADKRCKDFKTCGDMAKETQGSAHANQEIIMPAFSVGSRLLAEGKCAEAKPYKELIEKMMVVPLIQGTLRYAYITSTDKNAAEKAEAEGAVFAASVLPLVHACDEDAAATIYKNMKTGQGNTANYADVKSAFESVYGCLGIRGSDVGGIWNSETGSYYAGAQPLKIVSSSNNGSANIGLIIGCVVAGIVGGIVMYFIASKCCGGDKNDKQTTDISKPEIKEGEFTNGEAANGEATNGEGELVEIS
mmetsp:Transcript_44814/g.50647  ORF Transcript_44814/g.50647 Transcript_44814/m.50647 type:complete len:583 (+) Transcript_44814:91-1839(+)